MYYKIDCFNYSIIAKVEVMVTEEKMFFLHWLPLFLKEGKLSLFSSMYYDFHLSEYYHSYRLLFASSNF